MEKPQEQKNQAGRVIAHYGARSLVEPRHGAPIECTRPRHLHPVCGDYVAFQRPEQGQGRLCAIEPRRNAFPRVDQHHRPRVIAANLDTVVIVLAPEPAPSPYLADRYLVAAGVVGVNAVLLVNKSDLPGHKALLEQLQGYRGLGYALIACCAKSGLGLDALRRILRAGTGILAGQSGVGKSKLAAALLSNEDITSRDLSRSTGKGRHTTTTARLYHLPGGGALIDTPGVWEYGLWYMPQTEIERGFIEFRPFLGQCRFRDCRHSGEPDCALEQAAGTGQIKPWRLQAYQQILKDMERMKTAG